LKKLSELTKGQSINNVIERKILQPIRLTELCFRLAFPKQPTSSVVASVDKVVYNFIQPFSFINYIYITEKMLNFRFLNNKEINGLGTRPKLQAHQQE